MGAAVDPSFANIFVHKLEKQLFLTEPYTQYIVGYYRFVDYILTLRSVKTRIKEHRGSIRHFKQGIVTDTTVSRHFNTSNHNLSQLKWTVVKPLTRGGDMLKYRLQREAFWIKKLDTLQPKVLNDSWSIKCFFWGVILQ
ncbi:hypothetical protein XELAEV_18002987mg [Xenopus laevis]|nr:hypothetical protein XELAEV_18002987mg [Xenopus laevis]